MFTQLLCNHNYNVLSKEIIPSQFEHAMQVASKAGVVNVKIPHQMCDSTRKHITLLKCNKCSKIKQLVVRV